MLNTKLASGLLSSGLLLSGLTLIGFAAAPVLAQSALAQQSTAKQGTKTPAAKTAATKPAAKPTAKKAPPKPLVYVDDERNAPKAVESKTTDASATKPTQASVKKSSEPSTQKPLSADLTKAFAQNCSSVALTDSKARATYEVTFEHEPGSKGVKSAFGLTNAVHKTSKIEVLSKTGKELFSETGHSTNQLVKDACTAIGTPGTKVAKN
jgi:hypothetical protein